jgi:lipid-A-disaccharide synthase
LTRIVLAAGEASGDLLAGLVLPQLRHRLPQAQLAGIGGERMIAAGLDAWWHVRELSVRGYAEVLRHLPRLLKLRADFVRRAAAWPAHCFIGVDAPDFNLGVAARLKARGVKTVQYVAPAVWAWRPQRLAGLRGTVDRVLLVFPFEVPLFAAAGIAHDYVGHPLAGSIPLQPDAVAARLRLGLPPAAPTVAVLPGSRPAEIEALGPAFAATARLLQQADRALQIVVPAADEALHARLRDLLRAAQVDEARLSLTLGRSHDALEAADAVLVAGGTATLEAMLFQRPMAIAYRVPRLTEWLTRRKAIVPYFGLPNVLCGRYTVPEFVQEAVQPPALARAVLRYFERPQDALDLRAEFAEHHRALRRDTPALVAQAIADTVGR